MPCVDFKTFWTSHSASGSFDIFLEMGYFWTQSQQHLNFSLNLLIWFFWTFYVFKENFYFAQIRINEAFLGSTKQKYKNFTKSFHYTFPKFYVMIECLGCLFVQKWYFSMFLVPLLCFCGVDGYFVLAFIPKCLVSVTFTRITTSVPALFW